MGETHRPLLSDLPHVSPLKVASLVTQTVKNLPAMQKTQVQSLDWADPLEKEMATPPVFLPGESYGRRSLAGYIQSMGSQSVQHD